jgi:N-methylhydantoinase A
VVGDYLVRLEGRLKAEGLGCSLLVMQANGGLTTVEAVLGRPLLTVDSGPAGGVLGGRFASGQIGEGNILCADVGGTTFDVGIVNAGRVQMDPEPVIEQYAYLMPKIFVKSIGAGGGSIAWVDDGGSLRVGPQSAGSNPGPAAYGQGGGEPTVTDAHVVLGYLTPDFPLGGTVRVDRGRAEAAIARVAGKLGMPVLDVASAILEISNAHMADLVRKVTVERGLDPRRFVLFLYGGAGPVFAGFLAAQVGSTLAYVPAESGVYSALGMLTSDIVLQEERSVAYRMPLDAAALAELNEVFRRTDERVKDRFRRAGFDLSEVQIRRTVDMRFGMQVHELEVDAPSGRLSPEDTARLQAEFPSIYEATYGPGSAYTAAGIDLVTLRSIGTIPIARPDLGRTADAASAPSSLIGERQAVFSVESGPVATAVHAGERLVEGQEICGPAIVQRYADTVVVPPGTLLKTDRFGGLTLTRVQTRG